MAAYSLYVRFGRSAVGDVLQRSRLVPDASFEPKPPWESEALKRTHEVEPLNSDTTQMLAREHFASILYIVFLIVLIQYTSKN